MPVLPFLEPFFDARSWAECREVVDESGSGLLSDDLLAALDALRLRNAADPGAVRMIDERRAFVELWRAGGREAASREFVHADELPGLLSQLGDDSLPDARRLRLLRAARSLVERTAEPDLWTQLRADELVLRAAAAIGRDRDPDLAIEIDELLPAVDRGDDARRWGFLQLYRGLLALDPARGASPARWVAIRHLQDALTVFDRVTETEAWTSAQTNLGLAYARLETPEMVPRARHHLELALTGLDLSDRPLEREAIERNLARLK